MIVEIITGTVALIGAVTALVRELRGIKNTNRGQVIAEAEKWAWRAVQTAKQDAKGKLTREEIWREYQKEVEKYLSGKGLGKITEKEWDGIKDTAEVLTKAAKSAFNGLNEVTKR